MKKFLSLVVLTLVASAVLAGNIPINRANRPVPGEYIVVLNDDIVSPVSTVAISLIQQYGGSLVTTYDVLFKGFNVRMTEAQAEALNKNPLVNWVEENALFSVASGGLVHPPPSHVPTDLRHLDRVDQLTPSSGRWDNNYYYCSTGYGVRVYVVDSGVMPFHKEFCNSSTNRVCNDVPNRVDPASDLVTFLNNAGLGLPAQCWETGVQIFNAAAAHGTAVASLVGGKTFGVAKAVTLVDARAADCGGTFSVARINKVLEWIPNDPLRNWLPQSSTLAAQASRIRIRTAAA